MKAIIFSLALMSTNVIAATQYVYNYTKKETVVDEESDRVRPIASITKLMTAIVVLESNVSLYEKVPYKGFLVLELYRVYFHLDGFTVLNSWSISSSNSAS